MTIKSVDMQVLIQKVGDVARVQHSQHNESNHRQSEFAQLMVNQTLSERQTVRGPKESRAATVHERQKGEDKERSKDQKDPSEKQSEQDQEIFKDFRKGFTIDLKI